MAANNSYQEAVALIASANRVVQDPNSVGAALRTISLRLRGTKVKELEEAGEDTEGIISSKSKLRGKVKSLSGIDILTDTGAYKSTYDILLEISKVWEDMSDIDQAALLELIAGKTRSNTAAAILSNTEDLEAAFKSAQEAEGSALRENEKYLDSIQGRIDLFNNAIQTMWNTELDSGIVKLFVDLGTSLVEVVDNLGLINTLVFGLMGYFTIFKKNKLDLASMLGIHDIDKGWLNKRQKKTSQSQPIAFKELTGEQIDMFSDEYATQMQLNEKVQQLKTAKNELQSLKKTKWKDIEIPKDAISYTTSNRKKAYLNEVLIPNKEAEIVAIQKDIDDITNATKSKLNQSKMELKEDSDGQMMFDFDKMSQSTGKKNTKFFDIFKNGLGKGAIEKLTYDTEKLGIELDKLNGMDNAGIVTYMQNLDSLEGVGEDTKLTLAAYASTVKDGNYTLQGASQYVKDYNQNLAKLSKEATIAQFKQNMLNLAISAMTMLLSALIMKAVNSVASAQDEFEELSAQLSSTKSELDNINSELDTTKERIEELQNQGSLSFTEQEELDRLKAQNEELERQKDLKETIQKQQQKGVNSATVDTANDYYKNTGVKSGKTTGEIAGQGAQYGVMIGGAIAAAGGGAALASALASSVAAFAIPVVGPILAGLLITGTATAVAAGVGAAIGEAEEKVGESMDNMREQYTKLQEEYSVAQDEYANKASDGNYKKMQKAQEKLTEYESMMANHLAEMNAYYSQIDLSVYDPIEDAEELERLRNEINDFYDTQDKWLIQSGSTDAKSNAISRIFGENASDELKRIKKEIQDEITAEDWDESFSLSDYFNAADLDELTARLHEMGIYVYEVENYFKDMAVAEKEAADVSLYSVVTDINKITEGLDNLKSAFEEVLESGSVTAKTLTELNEVFGTLGDSWDNYVNTMFSGVSSTKEMEEATEELAKAFIDSKILTGEAISEYERMAYIVQLRNLGVTNAEEYIDDKIEENAYKAIQKSATYDENEVKQKWLSKDTDRKDADWDKLTSDERDKFASEEGLVKEIDLQKAQEIIDEYGIELKPRVTLSDDAPKDVKTQLEEMGKGGAVDLLLRPRISSDVMHAAGWDTEEGSISTVDTSTYSNEDNTIAMNFTPILPNGEVLSPKELQEYADAVIAGTREDDLGLQIGAAFTGDNAVTDAENAAQQIHLLHEQYLIDEISGNEYVSDLLQEQIGLKERLATLKNNQSEAQAMQDELNTIQEIVDHRQKMTDKYGYDNWSNSDANGWLSAEAAYRELGIDSDKKDEFIRDYNEWKALISANGPYAELLERKKELEEKLSQLNLDPTITQEEIDKLEAEIEGIDDQIETELTADVKLNLELTESTQLVDDIQSIFDTLVNAQKEYNEEGYLSVDTLQGLLELEPKYLALLYDENGNLNLNKDTLYQVAIARITDMKLKQQDMILSKAEQLAAEGTIGALYEQIDAAYGMSEAYDAMIAQRLKNVRAILEERKAAGTLDESFNVDTYISSIQHQLNAVEAASNSAINNIRNSLSSSGNTAKAEQKDALEKLQEKYERKISNLDNQQTYLENEIERLEAENKGVSKSYYEEQIKIEEQKMALLQQQRTELTKLLNSTAKGSDEWWEVADALWEVEHSIQESTLRTIEFRESIAELYKTAFEDLDKVHGDKDDLYSDRQAYIEKYMELLELQGKAKPASAYIGLIAEEEAKLANSMAELADLRLVLAEGMASGEIKAGDERWVEMQSSIRETEAAILDSKVAIEQYKEELKSLKVEAFELVRTAFSNRNDYYTNQQDYIEGYIDYLEASGIDATPEMYEKLIDIEKEKRANYAADLADAYVGFAKIEAAGYTAADEEWVDANNRIVELEKGIQDCDIAMAQWAQNIRELDFEKFDYFADRVSNINKELENVYKLVEDEDVAFDDGTWTKEGITKLSMLYHEMENNNAMIAKYKEELANLEEQYKSGAISEKDYTERAGDLTDRQWELIHANEDIKDSIIDINEARIDLVEEGLNEEIDAYRELIELKKEELDAERDLYNFRKDIEKQTKDIAELERKIAGLSGSDDAADIAERRKLEAQLREAKDGLNDTYYNHAKDSQSQALDDELEAYEKRVTDYVESLRETLEKTDEMIEQTFADVLLNADITYQNLVEIANTYGPALSANLMNPWQQMGNEAVRIKDQIGGDLLLLNDDNIATFSINATPLLKQPFESGGLAAEAFKILTVTQIDELQAKINASTSATTRDFNAMINAATTSTNTFSNTVESKLTGAVASAKTKAIQMENYLTYPWENGVTAANTWSSAVEAALNKTVENARKAAAAVSEYQSVIDNTPSYTTNQNSGGGSVLTSKDTTTQKKYYATCTLSVSAFGKKFTQSTQTGKTYTTADTASTAAYNQTLDKLKSEVLSYAINTGNMGPETAMREWNQVWSKKITKTGGVGYAKGTLGTKRDEWAYTDEPWLGDEIVLVPGANGNLQYMRKGTAVMPADISANLVEWGKINPDMTALANGVQGVNLMSNYVSKPEVNVAFDSLVHVDHCDEGTLKDLEKMVDTKINQFSKQINYAIKRYK